MSFKFSKWALPAALLLTTGSAVAMHGGKTSAGARISYHNMTLQGNGQTNFAGIGSRDYTNTVGGDHFIAHEKAGMGGDYCAGGEFFIGARTTDTGSMTHFLPGGPVNVTTTVKQDYSFGGRFKFGKPIGSGVTLYGTLGVMASSFTIDHRGGAVPTVPGSSVRKTLLGVSPGLGVKVKLTPNWCYHIDGSYTFYDAFRADLGRGNGAGVGSVYNLKIRPREAGISFGFSRTL
jgi:hypothetical protein